MLGGVEGWLPRRWRMALAGLFALSLLAHVPGILVIARHPDRAFTSSDSRQYEWLARNLPVCGCFSQSEEPPYQPEVRRTPGYPIFVAAIYALAGRSPLAVVLVQSIVAGLSAILTASLGRRLWDERRGLLGGALFALAPASLLMSVAVLTEALFTTLVLLAVWLLVPANENVASGFSPISAGISGLFLGLAILTRPVGLVLIPVGLILLLIRPPKTWPVGLAAWMIGLALALGPWMARNQQIFGAPVISSIGGPNLLEYNVASMGSYLYGGDLRDGREWAYQRLEDYRRAGMLGSEDSSGLGRIEARAARQLILEHPLAFAWVQTRDSLNGLRPGVSFMLLLLSDRPDLYDTMQRLSSGNIRAILDTTLSLEGGLVALAVLITVFYVALYLAGVIGLARTLLRREWATAVRLMLPIAALLYAPGAASNARFRAPVEPYLALLAGAGLVALVAWVRQRRGRGDTNFRGATSG
jgi:4-amino-4-deoxy-L-arabinose transferase-like glycosyltransferase